MKKTTRILLAFSLVLILSIAAAGTAFAEEVTLEGTVNWFDQEGLIMTMDTADGEVLVYLPEGFDFTGIGIGTDLALTGEWTGEGVFTATGIAAPADDDDTGDDDEEGGFQNAYCNGSKDKDHPMVAGLAATYGVGIEQIRVMFCNGHSIGQIMLALQTQALNGADPEETLGQRNDGKGWGEIWKDAGLIGNSDEGLPPGQAKKLDSSGEEQEKDNNGQGQDKDKKDNPGQSKKDNP